MTSKKDKTKFNNDNVIQLSNVVEQASKYDEIETYTLKNGEDIQFYPYFSRTKVKEIIEEFQDYMKSEDKQDKKFMESVTQNDIHIMLFWYFLAIKKFTHFGEQMKKCKKVKQLIPYYNALLETGLLEEITNDVFIYEELKKINEMFADDSAIMVAAMEFLNKYDESLDNARIKFKENVENNQNKSEEESKEK